jgi:general secretion pathway protein D
MEEIKMRNLGKIILILFLTLTLCNAYKLEKTLKELAQIVSKQNNINILISKNVKVDDFTFYVSNPDDNILLPAFKSYLWDNNLTLTFQDGFYLVHEMSYFAPEPEPINLYYIELKNLAYEDLKILLSLYDDVENQYIKNTNSLAIKATQTQYEDIYNHISKIDKSLQQVQFKITVLETSLNELKDRGSQIAFDIQSSPSTNSNGDESSSQSYNYFLNLITMPYSASTNILDTSKKAFYGTLKYLNQNGYTTIQNSPTLTAKSRRTVNFSSVQNIPYLVQTQEVEDTKTKQSNSYEYKDVGLKIDISPIVLDDVVEFDLSLTIEDILSSSNQNTPTVSKKHLKSNYTLKKGELLVLSGINKTTDLQSSYGVPLLQDIFIVGELFKFKSTDKIETVLTITIEVL